MDSFNRNLALTIFLLTVVIGAKLYSVGVATDNMRGFAYSFIHVLIVGIGTYFVIRRDPTP